MLQLASALLESPASLDFLYYVIHSPRFLPMEVAEFGGRPVYEFQRVMVSREARRRKAKEALDRLAESLCFVVESPKEDAKEDFHRLTEPSLAIYPYGINVVDESPTPRGIGSMIRINKSYLVKLTQLLAREGDNTAQILSMQFKIATSICHEIAHAVGHAADLGLLLDAIMESIFRELAIMGNAKREKERVKTNEPFFEDDAVAELGYCWEQAVLGGTIQWADQVDHPLFFCKWPSFLTDGEHPRRKGYKRTTTQYVVPMHYLRRLHKQEFWDGIEAGDTSALWIKKMVGIRVTNQDADIDPLGFPPRESEGDSPTDGPDSFRVCREEKGGRAVDPSGRRADETLVKGAQGGSDDQLTPRALSARRKLRKSKKY